MKSKIKTWKSGENRWKMHIPNWKIYKEVRDTLNLTKDKKFKPVVYMKDGDNIAWDIDLTREQLAEAKEIIKNFK